MIWRKDKDKLIIIAFINVIGVAGSGFLDAVNNYLQDTFDNSVKIVVLPVYDTNEPRYKFEIINPKLLNEEEYSKVRNQLEEIEKKYNDKFNI